MARRRTPVKVETAWPGSGSLESGIPEGWHLPGKAARLVGRSKDTLKRWREDGTYEPSGYTVRGKLTISLYSDDDIEEMKIIAGTKKAGRPPKQHDEGDDDAGSDRAAHL